jgi:hypothetical protein
MVNRIATALALTFITSVASAATLTETYDRSFDVRAGSRFTLENTNGRITVRSWDQPKIRVRAEKRVESRDSDMAKKAFAALKIEPTVTNGAVSIMTRYPRRGSDGFFDWLAGTNVSMSVTYEVTVPRSINIDIDNTNGSIDITEVRGSARVSNTNGHIELLRCAGDVDAETTNGHIKAELAEVTPGKAVRLETTNGRITVAVPRSINARLDAATTNGRINTELPVTTTEVHRTSLRGSINSGGPELRLRTTNGSIDIQAK